MNEVIVIGGGLAGLAASVALAQAGVKVVLLESRPRLGGRASSFEDAATGGVDRQLPACRDGLLHQLPALLPCDGLGTVLS